MEDKYAHGLFGQMSYRKYPYFQVGRLYFSHTSLICERSITITLWMMCQLSQVRAEKMETWKEPAKGHEKRARQKRAALLRAHSPSPEL